MAELSQQEIDHLTDAMFNTTTIIPRSGHYVIVILTEDQLLVDKIDRDTRAWVIGSFFGPVVDRIVYRIRHPNGAISFRYSQAYLEWRNKKYGREIHNSST